MVGHDIGPWFDALDSVVVSADGQHLAYVAGTDDGHEVLLDGASVGGSHQTVEGSLTISPDGTHVAYVTTVDGGRHLALDHTFSPLGYEGVSPRPFFTPDGAAHAWAVRGSTVYRLSASPS